MDKMLLKYIKNQKLMTLATCNKDIWACSVYYIISRDWKLYFVSGGESKHIKHIDKNNQVACVITDTNQKVTDKKVGVQIQGLCTKVSTEKEVKVVVKKWNRNIANSEYLNANKILKSDSKSGVYKINPKLIKLFDESLTEKVYIKEFK